MTFHPLDLWKKLLKGTTDSRPSRFHTQEGNLAPWTAYLELPIALGQWLQLRLFARYVEKPWIPPSATRRIQQHLSADACTLEVGAGMSTLWLAKRSQSLLSIEADQKWFDKLSEILAARGLRHVNLQFRWQVADMCDFSNLPDGSLDFCLVDGGPRNECINAALAKLKPNGWLYVDNTDLYPDTKKLLISLSQKLPCRMTFHRGFPPACLFVNEGALLELIPAG